MLKVFLIAVVALAVTANATCISDLEAAGAALGDAGAQVAHAIADCKSNPGVPCANDISTFFVDIGLAGGNLTNAATSCGGTSNPQCASDIFSVVTQLGEISQAIEKAIPVCKAGISVDCLVVVGEIAADIGKAAIGIATAVSACKPHVTLFSEKEHQFLFTKWVGSFGKHYETSKFFSKYETFKKNLAFIMHHNSLKKGYTLAINQFADLTSEEFKAQYLKTRPNTKRNAFIRSQNTEDLSNIEVAASVDWRTKGAVTPIKNQGQCGSCWAFSSTGSMEGAWAIKKGSLVSLSEQQLVDCAGSTGNQGCSGGLMDQAFEWVISNNGICSEAAYPYTAQDGTCQTCTPVATFSGYKDVTPGNETAILPAVNLGPVSIAIEADQAVFQFYSGGIMDDPSCGTQLDHGVLIVGYGTQGKDYWIVKNSWGTSWGEQGYVRLVRNKNQCGLDAFPSYPTV